MQWAELGVLGLWQGCEPSRAVTDDPLTQQQYSHFSAEPCTRPAHVSRFLRVQEDSRNPQAASSYREWQPVGNQLPSGILPSAPCTPDPCCYRLDEQLQVTGLECVLVLGVQVLKLPQQAQVVHLHVCTGGGKSQMA